MFDFNPIGRTRTINEPPHVFTLRVTICERVPLYAHKISALNT